MITFWTSVGAKSAQAKKERILWLERLARVNRRGKNYSVLCFADGTRKYFVDLDEVDKLPRSTATRALLRCLSELDKLIDALLKTELGSSQGNKAFWKLDELLHKFNRKSQSNATNHCSARLARRDNVRGRHI